MTYSVVHTTRYRYDAPVSRCRNEAHLRPRDTDRQRCLASDLTVLPAPVAWSERTDFFGNQVAAFTVEGPFDELVVTATSRVAVTVRPAPPEAGPPWEEVRDLLSSDLSPEVLDARRVPVRVPPRPPPAGGGRLRGTLVPAAAAPVVDAVVELTDRIFTDFVYDPGFTTVATPLDEVLSHRRGVCQDFAHLAIACLRTTGLAARYVSGYIETVTVAGEDRMIGADASHAWPSVFVPGSGWLDIDPTNNQLVGSAYVTTAWGRDYADVSPLKGIVFGGGANQMLDVSVDVVRSP